MRTKILSLASTILLFAITSRGAVAGHDALVGKWTATLTNEDLSKETTDKLTFKGMKFTSDELKKQGYEPASYEDDPSPIGAAAKFSVTLTNKDGDTAKWTGTATAGEMTGDITITKKDGSTQKFSFKAQQQK